MKKYSILEIILSLYLIGLLFFPIADYFHYVYNAYAVSTNYTAVAAGGNWNSNNTWGVASGFPVAADNVTINGTMTGTVTVNVASACNNVNMSGNGGTVAFNQTLTTTGNVTLGGVITANGSGKLQING